LEGKCFSLISILLFKGREEKRFSKKKKKNSCPYAFSLLQGPFSQERGGESRERKKEGKKGAPSPTPCSNFLIALLIRVQKEREGEKKGKEKEGEGGAAQERSHIHEMSRL